MAKIIDGKAVSARSYLPPNTMIDDRYLAGKVLSYNGESVIYIGYDTMSGRRVDIREYFPDTLASRNADGRSIRVNEGRQIQFKAYMGDYLEMIRKLSRMRTLSCVVQVLGVVEANNTVYAVMEHVDGSTVRQYLSEQGTMLTWPEASDLFLPMMKTLRLIHQDGILHRGISADTILITRNHTVKIDGFAISAVRAARTELVAELFPGFSAPEQYSTISPHGTWTDVYAVSALLYTVLTGQRPPEALIRSPEKTLMPPRERNETIPPAVSDALLEGLELNIRGRIQDMDTLIRRLTGEDEVRTMPAVVEPAVSVPSIRIPEGDWPEESDEPEGNTAYYRPAQPAGSRKEPAASHRRETAAEEKERTKKLVMISMGRCGRHRVLAFHESEAAACFAAAALPIIIKDCKDNVSCNQQKDEDDDQLEPDRREEVLDRSEEGQPAALFERFTGDQVHSGYGGNCQLQRHLSEYLPLRDGGIDGFRKINNFLQSGHINVLFHQIINIFRRIDRNGVLVLRQFNLDFALWSRGFDNRADGPVFKRPVII